MIDRRTQTFIIIGLAIASLVGAVSGSIASVLFSSQLSLFESRLSNNPVDKQIIGLIEEESATIAVVERVTPSIVSIVVKKERGQLSSQINTFGLTPFFVQQPALTEEETHQLVEVSSGSGFFVSQDGYILTNRHVVDEPGVQFVVVTNDGQELKATLVDIDPFQDIAILDVEGEGFPVATLGDSNQIRIGQTVIAIGNTLSEFRNTVTKGVISGINRRVTASSAASAEVIEQAIQTDAAINPGNSGGPLINLRGEVVGVNTAVSVQGEAIAFAIPINQAQRAIQDVHDYGRIIRPWLGVRYVLVQKEQTENQILDSDYGALVVAGTQPGQPGVIKGSPADQAGIIEGDIISKLNNQTITKENSLSELISQHRPGDQVELEVLRDGERLELVVTLAEYGKE